MMTPAAVGLDRALRLARRLTLPARQKEAGANGLFLPGIGLRMADRDLGDFAGS